MKKRLTMDQEFQIMKLVLDKFLWVGTAIMVYGLYFITLDVANNLYQGISYMAAGAIVLIIFLVLIIKEYEITA